MSRYVQRKDYEGWVVKSGVPFKLACCDCGLVHQIVLVVNKDGKVGIAAKRDNRATGQRRRRHAQSSEAAEQQRLVLSAVRKRWGGSTPYRRGRMTREMDFAYANPYPEGTQAFRHFKEAYEKGP